MKAQVVVLLGGGLLALALHGALLAAPEDLAVGSVRAVLARDGAALREQPSPLASPRATLPYGTQVRVAEVKDRWIRVTPVAPTTGPAADGGWLRATQTVEPFALTQGGQRGVAAARGAAPTATEISAAGRQFDPETEKDYRQAHPDLERFYPLVDRVERSTPDDAAVRRFILEGRLGRPEGSR